MSKTLCIYHKNCFDGFTAAWIIKTFLMKNQEVEMIAAHYNDPVPDLTGKVVYIVDFSWTPELLLPHADTAEKIVIIDHHIGAIEAWAGVEHPHIEQRFNNFFSGAMLVWQYFEKIHKERNPNGWCVEPAILKFAQDHDLQRKRYRETPFIVAAIGAHAFLGTQDWDRFTDVAGKFDSPEKLALDGEGIDKANRSTIRSIIARGSVMVDFLGYRVPMVNMPYEFATIAGTILSEGHPFAIMYDDWLSRGKRRFSLRSQKIGGANVQVIAKKMGGNGHGNAAGFEVNLEDDLGMYLKILN